MQMLHCRQESVQHQHAPLRAFLRVFFKLVLELEQILVPNLNHIRSTVDRIGTGLFF